jgi:hypothetical protein
MRAVPFTFRAVGAHVGRVVAVAVTGEAGGNWYVERGERGWEQTPDPSRPPTATVTMEQDTACKLVTKRRSREAARRQFPCIRITGDEALGLHVLGMVSVMA